VQLLGLQVQVQRRIAGARHEAAAVIDGSAARTG
jgi:hypothetical protein